MAAMKFIVALTCLTSLAQAQTISLRPIGPSYGTPLCAPMPLTFSPSALDSSSLAPALSLSPMLAPSALAPLAITVIPAALVPVSAAAASSDERPKAGTPRAAASLVQRAAEFERLVSELMGDDKPQSDAAAVALRALKDDHLNSSADGKRTRILDLKPMQISAGMLEVQDKAKDLRAMKSKELESWLKERSVPFIEDYKGRKRPVDHHHEARAAWEANQDEIYTHRYLDDELHARLKALPRDQFYAVTRAMGLFYDRDQFGAGPHDPNHLPEDVRSMADDSFRSVAWQVRKRGGYDKTSVPFAEFQWAQHFRERVKTYPTRADFEAAVVEALKLAHDTAARNLPGWKPR